MKTYFVIRCSEDGLTIDGPLSRDTMEHRLAQQYYGADICFSRAVPRIDGFCPIMAPGELMVIEGRLIQPTEEAKVTKWVLP